MTQLIANNVVVETSSLLAEAFVGAYQARDILAREMMENRTEESAKLYQNCDEYIRMLGKRIFGQSWGTVGDKYSETSWRNLSSSNVKLVA